MRLLALRSVRLLVLAGVVVGGTACSTLPAATAGVVGCYEDDIDISHAEHGPSGDTWTATCHGHVYDCARDEKEVEGSGWGLSTDVPSFRSSVGYQQFQGKVSGDTYCIQREKG